MTNYIVVTNLRWKIILLLVLLLVLGVLMTTAWAKNEYSKAREQSIMEIEESGGSIQYEEENEFHSIEEELEYIHVLLVGVDQEDDGVARTDTIMLAQYHPNEGIVRLVSLMRDTYVKIPGYMDNKINASYSLGGMELLRQTIKENFEVDVHYYAQVNFNGFIRIVDIVAPEGILVNVENRMYYENNSGSTVIDFHEGTHVLDGTDALNYVRFRSDSQNDFGRVKRQQEILGLLKQEIMSLSSVTKIPQLLCSIEPYIQTNMSTQDILILRTEFFNEFHR